MKCRHRNKKRKFLFWKIPCEWEFFQLLVDDYPKWFLKIAKKEGYELTFYGGVSGENVKLTKEDYVTGKSWFVAKKYDYIINDRRTHCLWALSPDDFKKNFEIIDDDLEKRSDNGFCGLSMSYRDGRLHKDVV